MRCSLVACAWILATSAVGAADEAVDYLREVKPLLARHCGACHSPLRQRSGLRLDTAALMIQGGDSGPAVVPGNSSDSLLIQAVTGTAGVPSMPPEGAAEKLSAAEIALLERWIDAGAKAPVETPAPDPRSHWAFQGVVRPAVPQVDDARWRVNPIDAFIAAEHARHGLRPRPAAERHIELRRVYLDLIGLPPTGDELHAYLADDSPDAYERVVDRLLGSPQYGERWGRQWMDVWRYSDWAGWNQQIRDSQPHIWHWRDWIIESLNADRPYDEMVVAMLAADELVPDNRDELRATGFLARNFKLLSREQWLQDTVEHTAKAFLGLTMNCCRCHDHMSDPIEQVEYYRFRAIFEPHQVRLDRLPGIADTAVDGLARVFDKDAAVPTYLYVRGDERNPEKDHPIEPGLPAVLRCDFQVAPVDLPRAAYDPGRQDFVFRDDLAAGEKAVAAAAKRLADLKQKSPGDASGVALAELELALLQAKQAALAATAAVETLEDQENAKGSEAWAVAAKSAAAAQRQEKVAQTRRDLRVARSEHLKLQVDLEAARAAAKDNDQDPKVAALVAKVPAAEKKVADAEQKRTQAERDVQAEPTTAFARRTVPTYPPTSTGRRLALARAIVDRRNPLAARVAVNQIWLRHFDAALVPSVFNFGVSGTPPVNQPLLDWLAAELVDPQPGDGSARPWTMKRLHRLIVTSQTYRLASTSDPACAERDPDNRYLWRAPTRRMEAEAVRDSVLYVAGQLDLARGGPDLDHQHGLTVKRRSLYFRHAAEKQMPFLKLFDMASVGECYERRESVVPQQALALANSELTLVQARLLARRLHNLHADSARDFVTAAVEQTLARPVRDEELQLCLDYLAEQEARFRKHGAGQAASTAATSAAADPEGKQPSTEPTLRAREHLVHALLNHNDFVTIR